MSTFLEETFVYKLHLGHTLVHCKEVSKDYKFWLGLGLAWQPLENLGSINGQKTPLGAQNDLIIFGPKKL